MRRGGERSTAEDRGDHGLQALVGNVVDVESVRDIATAFDVDVRKQMGKTIMKWNM